MSFGKRYLFGKFCCLHMRYFLAPRLNRRWEKSILPFMISSLIVPSQTLEHRRSLARPSIEISTNEKNNKTYTKAQCQPETRRLLAHLTQEWTEARAFFLRAENSDPWNRNRFFFIAENVSEIPTEKAKVRSGSNFGQKRSEGRAKGVTLSCRRGRCDFPE